MSLPRYEEYKNSGVATLGSIPAHWDPNTLKRLVVLIESGVSVNAVDEPASLGSIGVLKTSSVYSGVFDPSENKVVVAEDLGRVACSVKSNSLIVSRMNTPALVGAAGLVQEDAENLFLPDRLWQIHFSIVLPKFAHYWTAAPSYRAQVEMACAGTSASMQNLSQEEFLSFVLPLPPQGEQVAIVAFLDRETAKIDALIAEQEKLIALLTEKRQATISHAVTRGLNPNAPMKDSGIAWLGKVPAHWNVKKLRHVATVVRGASPRPAGDPMFFSDDNDSGLNCPWVTVAEVTKDESVYLDQVVEYLTPAGVKSSQYFEAGILVFTNSGATLGVPKILAIDCCANDGILAFLNLSREVNIRFMYYFLLSTTERLRTEMKQGGGQPNLNTGIVKDISFAVPPCMEQLQLIECLEAELLKLERLRVVADSVITLLKERRSALIAAAVTGQIDVRGAVG